MELKHIVTAQEEGMTLQHVLRSVMGLSARETRNAKQQGGVTVNGAPFFSNQKVSAGMTVRVVLGSYEQTGCQAETALPAPQVLFEDDTLIAVFKPALLQCHPSPSAPGGTDTLEARVQQHLGKPAHPVHRLDAETTGIVLFAKMPFAQAHLQHQMQEGTFSKTYRAWCFGAPAPACGEIDAPIARITPDSFTRIVRADGQRAVSRYETLETIPLSGGGFASLLSLSPITGRTHQLRVHMAHIGCPLLGDQRYFTDASQAAGEQLSLRYHQLSAVSLRFLHPASAQPVQIDCAPEFSFQPE
ncbi:MAG: RluA family pseudouridine synthase [Clostridia bacterium]|nr:RluA family pseudouridine synthase [Clostridia bacterium]